MFTSPISIAGLFSLNQLRFGLLLHLVVAVSLAWIPLFDILGFERSFVTGLIAGPVAGICGVAVVHKYRDHRPFTLATAFSYVTQLNLLFLLPTIMVGLVVEKLTQACNPQEGLNFILLLPGSTVIWGAAAGVICGRIFSKRRWAYTSLILIFLLCLAGSLFRLYQEPQIFAFSMPFGYWPGSLYDEEVGITQALLTHRILTMIIGLAAVFAGEGLLPNKGSTAGRLASRLQRIIICLLLSSGAYYLHGLGEKQGFNLDRSSLDRILSRHVNNARFELRIDPSIPQQTLENLISEHELHYQSLVDFFDATPHRPIRVYVYKNVDQKRFLMGAHHTQIARPWAHEIHIHGFNVPHRVLKHELAHVFAAEFATGIFKVPASNLIFVNMGIVEGTAVAADWRAEQLTVHEWARAMREMGNAPDPRNILYPQGFWAISASRAYTIAGSFLRYLIDEHGIDPFKKLYRENDFEAAYKQTLDQLVTNWENFLNQVPLNKSVLKKAEHRFTRPGIFKKVCAHESAKMARDGYDSIHQGDFKRGIALLEQVQKNRPYSAQNYLFIAQAYARKNQFNKARNYIEKAKQLPSITSQSKTMVGIAEADLEWKAGNSTTAKSLYQNLDTQALPKGQRRLITAKLDALKQNERLKETLRAFLFREYSQPEGVIHLTEQVNREPQNGLLRYLLSRQLEQIGMCQRGLREIETAVSVGLPNEDFYQEAEQMKGRLYMCAKDYQAAQSHFQALVDTSSRAAQQLKAQEWKKRAKIRGSRQMITE